MAGTKMVVAMLAASAAAVLMLRRDSQAATTAGDDESNIISDTVDNMKNVFDAWPSGSEPYRDTINQASSDSGVPALVLAWLLWKESRYNPAIIDGTKRSRAGALGIAQFMPATAAQELGSVDAALNPDVAIPGAARYLRKLYNAAGGTWAQALAAYNWGIGNVTRHGIDAAPPETVDYYTTILAHANSGSEAYA